MDCWCCFPCFGLCKGSKRNDEVGGGDEDLRPGMGEREPLLPKAPCQSLGSGSNLRYTASAPNSATGTTLSKRSGVGPDAFRDQVSEILFSLNAGEVPSQDQITAVLKGVLSSGMLDVQVQQESERSENEGTPEGAVGRNLLGDVQELLEAFVDFGVEKNEDDKIQSVFSDFEFLMMPPNHKHNGGTKNVSAHPEETSSELAFDTTTFLSALRTLALASLVSPSFRHTLGQLASIVRHHDGENHHDPKLEKESIVIAIQEIIDGVQADPASWCAMRAILILVRKYGRLFPLSTTTREATVCAPVDSEIAVGIGIPEPAKALLKNIKEILERCAGGKSLNNLLTAFVLVMSDSAEEDRNRLNAEQRDDNAVYVPALINEETSGKLVGIQEDGEEPPKQLSPSISPPTPGYTENATPRPTPILPAQQSMPPSANPPNVPISNGNENATGDNHTRKKPSARNRKKKEKAKMKRKQKAMEKKAQEIQNESADGPVLALTSTENESEDEEHPAGTSTGIRPTTPEAAPSSSSGKQVTLSHEDRPSFSAHEPKVSLTDFLTRLGHFFDNLLEREHAHGSNSISPASGREGQSHVESSTTNSNVADLKDLQRLVDDAFHLFADTSESKGESQPPPPIHTLLAEARQFARAIENDQVLVRLYRAADTFRRNLHHAWGSEASYGLSQMALKRLLDVLPLPLPLPLPLGRTSLSQPSQPGFGTTNVPNIELKMGNWEGVLTDLWVSGNSSSSPSMLGGGERSRGRGTKWIMEGARVVEASLVEAFDVGVDDDDDRSHDNDHDNNADDDNDNDDETTTLLSSGKANNTTKSKNRSQSKSTARTTFTQRTYASSNGTTRAASSGSDEHHSRQVPSTKSRARVKTPMRLRMRIQVPLSDPAHHQHLHLRAGIENAHYRVHYTGPCSTLVGYEDEGVLDVEFGVGSAITGGEVDIEVDVHLGFEDAADVNDGEGMQDIEQENDTCENKQKPTQSASASTVSLFDRSSPLPAATPSSPDRTSSHISLSLSPVAQTPTMNASGVVGKASPGIPEIIVHDSSSEEDIKVDIRNEHSVPDFNGNARDHKREGLRQPRSLKVLSTTVVPFDHLALQNQEDIEIDITRRESTSHHWPTTEMFLPPLGGSRGALVDQMIRLAVKSWVRGIIEDLVREAVEQWLTGIVGGCERVWEVAGKVFAGEGMW